MLHLKDLRRHSDVPAHALQLDQAEDVLAPGDIIGKGAFLKGHVVSLLPTDTDRPIHDENEQFQVIKELGKGSYAVVYLVHQVSFSSNSESAEDAQILGDMDTDMPISNQEPFKTYGRNFAIKCLSKANLDQEELEIQLAEVTIHQSLPLHPNIVALHKALHTSSYLLLVLEYVPGEDLFYFLEQARDHYPSPSFPDFPDSPSQLQQQQTPPTPSLLSSLHPAHLLSRTRLRLIASMFAQMCDAVAACHAVGVFHRDIKPENFIVTDGRYLDEGAVRMNGDRNKGRVVVKLTDFGLSTREEDCSDMDCGSAPYMSYECRNNIAPTYKPREADVWSLGIVLINMLYHINPWTDTAHGACPSFTAFRQDPVGFFMRLFAGMTHGFADTLARGVFCVDNGQTKVNGRVKEKRMSAAELGAWVRSSLVDSLATNEGLSSGSVVNGGPRAVVNGGHRLSLQMRLSHRPVSRAASSFGGRLGSAGGVGGGIGSTMTSPRILTMTLSRAPSLAPALEREEREVEAKAVGRLSVQVVEEQEERLEDQDQAQQDEEASPTLSPSRTSTTTKRRKRGARNKGKVATTTTVVASKTPERQHQDETLKTLADASQSLAREISSASKVPSIHRHRLKRQPSSLSENTHTRDDIGTMGEGEYGTMSVGPWGGDEEGSPTSFEVANTILPPSMASSSLTLAGTSTTKPPESNQSSLLSPFKSSSNSTRTASKDSSIRAAITTITNGVNSEDSDSRPKPPSALLGKPMEGETSGTSPLKASGSTQPQAKVVAKKSSKWTIRFGKNNSSSGGGMSATFATPAVPAPALISSSSEQGASRPIPIPIGGPGHVLAFAGPSRSFSTAFGYNGPSTQPTAVNTPGTMSPTVTNVTNLIMGLDPVSAQPHNHHNGSSGNLVGGGVGGGYPSSSPPWSRGRRGESGTGSLMSAGGQNSPHKLKSSSRSPGPGAPSRTGGFGSSASSSSASLASGPSSWIDMGQGPGRTQAEGKDKWPSDRIGNRATGQNSSGGWGVGGRPLITPSGAAFGAGGGRHGSVGAAGGPFASSANSMIAIGMGSGGTWRSGNAMRTGLSATSMNLNASGSTSGSGGASLHGSVSASSGTTSPGGSTSAFTRYSNSSLRSVSTTATSVSSGSGVANWRSGGRGGAAVARAASTFSDDDGAFGSSATGGKVAGGNLLKGDKKVMEIPYPPNELSRRHQDFIPPPARRARTRNKKGNNNSNFIGTTSGGSTTADVDNINKLDTIIERPLGYGPTLESNGQQEDPTSTTASGDDFALWRDASTSTTDLAAAAFAPNDDVATGGGTGGRVKKVQKGQIHALAKMLSALRKTPH